VEAGEVELSVAFKTWNGPEGGRGTADMMVIVCWVRVSWVSESTSEEELARLSMGSKVEPVGVVKSEEITSADGIRVTLMSESSSSSTTLMEVSIKSDE